MQRQTINTEYGIMLDSESLIIYCDTNNGPTSNINNKKY